MPMRDNVMKKQFPFIMLTISAFIFFSCTTASQATKTASDQADNRSPAGSQKNHMEYRPRIVIVPLAEEKLSREELDLWRPVYEEIFNQLKADGRIILITDTAIIKELKELCPDHIEDWRCQSRIKSKAYDYFIDQIVVTRITPDKTAVSEVSLKFNDDVELVDRNYSLYTIYETLTQSSRERFIRNYVSQFLDRALFIDNVKGRLDYNARFTNLQNGKPLDFADYKGKLMVISTYSVNQIFYVHNYPRLKTIYTKLRYKYPDIVIVFGFLDAEREYLKLVLDDEDFSYPVVDIKAYTQNVKLLQRNTLVGFDGNYQAEFFDQDPLFFIYRYICDALPESECKTIPVTLVEAARNNNEALVSRLLSAGADVQDTEDNRSALDWAVIHDNRKMFDAILRYKTKLQTGDISAVYAAIVSRRNHYFQRLMEKSTFVAIPLVKLFYIRAAQYHNDYVISYIEKKYADYMAFLKEDFDYKKMLNLGIKHILQYKYGEKHEVEQWEKMLSKAPDSVWLSNDIYLLMQKLGLETEYSGRDLGLFFYYLVTGEPVITRVAENHSVVAYSFDQTGVWISDSGANKRKHVAYETLFKNKHFKMNVIKKKDK
jgi:hypothetical protein